jgi:hypothetical protein
MKSSSTTTTTTTTATNTTTSNSIYNMSKESNDSNFTAKSATTTATADKKNKNNNRITVLTFNSFVTDYRLALYSESIQSVPLTSSSTSSIVIPEFLIEVEMRTKELVPGYNPVLQYLGYNVVLKHHKWKLWKRFNEFMELHEEILRVLLYYIIQYYIIFYLFNMTILYYIFCSLFFCYLAYINDHDFLLNEYYSKPIYFIIFCYITFSLWYIRVTYRFESI